MCRANRCSGEGSCRRIRTSGAGAVLLFFDDERRLPFGFFSDFFMCFEPKRACVRKGVNLVTAGYHPKRLFLRRLWLSVFTPSG